MMMLPYFDFRAFIDGKHNVHAAGRDLSNLRGDRRILVASFRLVFLKHILCPLHFARIVLRFRRKSDASGP